MGKAAHSSDARSKQTKYRDIDESQRCGYRISGIKLLLIGEFALMSKSQNISPKSKCYLHQKQSYIADHYNRFINLFDHFATTFTR